MCPFNPAQGTPGTAAGGVPLSPVQRLLAAGYDLAAISTAPADPCWWYGGVLVGTLAQALARLEESPP